VCLRNWCSEYLQIKYLPPTQGRISRTLPVFNRMTQEKCSDTQKTQSISLKIYHTLITIPSSQNGGQETIKPSGERDTCRGVSPGDRVELLIDNPGGAVGLFAGATGTVLCCDSDSPGMPIMVSWDGWSEGHMYDGPCDTPPGAYLPDSGWWMQCNEFSKIATDCVKPPLGDLDLNCRVD